jgi:phage terminase large subunit-like protein
MEESLLAQAVRRFGGPERFLAHYGPKKVAALMATWAVVARPKQILKWEKRTVLVLAGRGFGKSASLAGACHQLVDDGRYGRIALVAPTAWDARHVLVEGDSGIKRWARPDKPKPVYEPSNRKVTFWNGAEAILFSAEEPDRLRGPQFHATLGDEAAAWKYPDETWTQMKFVTRLPMAGATTRRALFTTPRPIKLIRELIKDPRVHVVKGTTFENAANLDADFYDEMMELRETRTGRQELNAEVLDDNPNALFHQANIDLHRVRRAPDLIRVVGAVDPMGSQENPNAECGIVYAGLGWCGCKGDKRELHGFVFDDRSKKMSPPDWAKAAVLGYHYHEADKLLGEVNFGGDMVESNIRSAEGGKTVAFKKITASRGKRMRHEPVGTLYERGVVHHVGHLAKLETEMTEWDPFDENAKSPNRLDALSIVIHELMLGKVKKAPVVGVRVAG